jgi:hypothetical protein
LDWGDFIRTYKDYLVELIVNGELGLFLKPPQKFRFLEATTSTLSNTKTAGWSCLASNFAAKSPKSFSTFDNLGLLMLVSITEIHELVVSNGRFVGTYWTPSAGLMIFY